MPTFSLSLRKCHKDGVGAFEEEWPEFLEESHKQRSKLFMRIIIMMLAFCGKNSRTYTMNRVATGAHLLTSWFCEPEK